MVGTGMIFLMNMQREFQMSEDDTFLRLKRISFDTMSHILWEISQDLVKIYGNSLDNLDIVQIPELVDECTKHGWTIVDFDKEYNERY